MKDLIPTVGGHTPDSEELSERTECFECGATTSIDEGAIGGRGLAVAEGILLCHACCVRYGAGHDHESSSGSIGPWFDELVGKGPHP